MTNYSFEYESIQDTINKLENRIKILEHENIETTNTLYEILNRLDKLDDPDYNLHNFSLGDS